MLALPACSQLALARQFIKNAACTKRVQAGGAQRRGTSRALHFHCATKMLEKVFHFFFAVFYVQNDSDQCRNGHNTTHTTHTHTHIVCQCVCVCINCCQTVAKAFQDVEFYVVQTFCSVI